MVKQKSTAYLDRNMNVYKMHTPYGNSRIAPRQNPPQSNRVQVAHSNGGCCSSSSSSKKPSNVPSKPVTIQHETPRETAHDRSHLKNDPPNPYNFSRINRKSNRIKKPYYYQQNGKNKIHSTGQTTYIRQTTIKPNPGQQQQQPPTTTTNKSCCCTIL